jgi:hypothetical protein
MRPGATILLAALAVVSLVGCRDKAKRKEAPEAGIAAQTRAPADGPAVPALSAGRFGPLGSGSQAGQDDLERAFPGMQVEPRGRRLQVSRGEAPLFMVAKSDDGAVSSVEVFSREVKTDLGPRIGDHFEDLERTGPLECNGGVNELAGQVLCSPRKARNLAYVFTVIDRRYAGDDVPSDKQHGLLSGAAIKRIHWKPPEP